MEPVELNVPLLNANEPEAKLVGIHVKEGQYVEKGDILFSFETTKATSDFEAPVSGFVQLRQIHIDDLVSVGEILGWISENPEDKYEKKQDLIIKHDKLEKLRITDPARNLALQLGVDLDSLPTNQLITEQRIRDIAMESQVDLPETMSIDPEKSVLIYGGGGHAKAVMEMLNSIGKYEIVGIIDDQIPSKTLILGIPVLGSRNALVELKRLGVQNSANGVGGILDIKIRKNIFEILIQTGYSLPKLIHPRAMVERSAVINNGVQVFANAYVGSDAILEPYCMVNTNAVVSHDCVVGDYSHISPGALLAGHVQVGKESLVGMGVTTSIGVKIGNNVRIGNGAIIYADIPSKTIIPSGKIWSGQ